MDYKIGDKVSYLGWVGLVTDIIPNTNLPIKCEFQDGDETVTEMFTMDGRLSSKHDRAALRLIERPKPTRTVKLFRAIFRSHKDMSYYISPRLFETAEEAQQSTETATFIKFVPGPFQIEKSI